MGNLLGPGFRIGDIFFRHAGSAKCFAHLAELATTLAHHLVSRATYRIHGHGAKQEGEKHTDKETTDHFGVGQRHVVVAHHLVDGGLTGRNHIEGLAAFRPDHGVTIGAKRIAADGSDG